MMQGVEWRWKVSRDWSKAEVAAWLDKAARLPHNFDVDEREMTLDNGWSQVESQSIIARERPGAPRAEDAFDKLKHAVTRMGFWIRASCRGTSMQPRPCWAGP